MAERKKFAIEVEMEDRWVPHFLGLLTTMQTLGQVGSSRTLRFFSDGDGDFRPRFTWDIDARPVPADDDYSWDAG